MIQYLSVGALAVCMLFSCKSQHPNDAATATVVNQSDSAMAENETSTQADTLIATSDTNQNNETATASPVTYTGEVAVIYKTKNDYHNLVPVTLNAAKTEIVAYPSPADVYYNGKLAYPIALKNEYWLDNRGIGVNSAFLKITYDKYSKLKQAPLLTEMFEQIEDKDPFVEIYNIGTRSRFTNEVEEINKLIEKGDLKKFKKLK